MGDTRLGQPEESKRDDSPFRPALTINDINPNPPLEPVARTGDNAPKVDPNKNGGDGQAPWRRNWGEVAPGAAQMQPVNPKVEGQPDPNRNGGNGQAPWRRGWGEVAPGAGQLQPVNPNDGKDPNQNGGNGVPPWRATPGVAPVVPGPGDRPVVTPPTPGTPGVPDWKDYADKNKPAPVGKWDDPNKGSGVGKPGDGPSGGGPQGKPLTQEQLDILMDSKRPKTNVLGYLYTGGLTGAAMNASMYGLDTRLLAVPEAERSGMMKMWEKISPTAKKMAHHTEAARLATTAFSSANQAHGIAQLELDAVANVPRTMFQAAEARAVLLQPVATDLALVTAQKNYLQNHAAITSADDVIKTIGPAAEVGKNGVLFEKGSTAAIQLEQYAATLRAKAMGAVGVAPADFTAPLAEVEAKLAGMSSQVAELGTVQQRLVFFRSGLAGNKAAVDAVLGTSVEVAAGQKLFERGSAEAAELINYATKAEAHAAVTKTLDAARGAMGAKETALKAAMERGVGEYHGSLAGTTLKGFAKGVGISAATMAAGYGTDYAMGQMLGYKPQADGMGRFLIDGVAIPSILLSGMQPRTKVWMGGLLFAGARATDYFSGSMASTEASMLLRPNTVDAIGVTGFALAPIPGKYKAMGIAGTLALGRGYNMFARATGLDGFNNSGEVLDADLTKVRDLDSTTQTIGSFDRSVQKAKELGVENPGVLEYRLTQAMDRTNLHPVDKERQVAALAMGLGLARLQKGSRLTVADYTPSAYFLTGTKADFTCTAAEQLNSAVTSLETARKYAIAHPGEVVNGQKLDDAYVRQLDELKGKVVTELNAVYGEQDIEGMYSAVRELSRTKVQQLLTFIVEGNQKLGALGAELSPSDVRYGAKMARDLALANLAYAESCVQGGNGEDARGFYNAAVDHIKNAKGFEPDSKNNPKIERLIDSVRARIPGAVAAQWGNNINNPFQIRPKGP
ncbi:MAG: hypothetical protein K2W95_18990 [Candidatus Obscuribacterales bacterium]|nr:hypothetical protein [Candidatus Obscuribacterales bacterium]